MKSEKPPVNIQPQIKKKLKSLAKKYETSFFLNDDPSQFLYYYKNPNDIELCALIASLLSFGSRKQFIPKIKTIMQCADLSGGIFLWIKNKLYEKDFSKSDSRKFYRFYSYKDMNILFTTLSQILTVESSLGIFFHSKYNELLNLELDRNEKQNIHLVDVIAESFPLCDIVPKTKSSAKKRLCMFLRWMVRNDSPVDIGLWTWFSKKDLLIPVDVHVLKESERLGLIPVNSAANRKTAELITKAALCIFPDDPCKLDFALFGTGVNQ